jgi:alpha-N-arabinofuranosidase
MKRKQMKTLIAACLTALIFVTVTRAAEFHVAPRGNDANPGTQAAPFRTIQHAADLAQPGDVVTVHAGVYRERISPPRGGESDARRIVYRAAPGEKVEITGSEVAKNWERVGKDTWKATIPNSFFGRFNPYSDVIHGDWFDPKGRTHHTGAVYLNGDWLTEAATRDDVIEPISGDALWFGEVDGKNTTLWAQFKGSNPNQQTVEINVRQTVFYPEKEGINYITVRGFTLRDAATPWAPPTAGQIGLIGTHWSRGWIIENNRISYSTCSGIALGKYGDQWDNTSADTAEGYVKTIDRALTHGWSKENIGHHIVRNNNISHCEQAGIVGSLGAAFSTVTGNTIYDIHVRRLFSGAEMAGIKFHGAIDTEISRNHIYRTCRGLWLDWMAQGTRVSGNLFHDNTEDVFVEVDHGPFLMDNNVFLSALTLRDGSQGGAYVHNLFAGAIKLLSYDSRQTPFLKTHSTEVAGYHDNPNGDDRYYNNLFAHGADLSIYDNVPLRMEMGGNVFLKGAKPSKLEKNAMVKPDFDPAIKLLQEADGVYLEMKYDPVWNAERTRQSVMTKLLGRTIIPNLPYEQRDGSPTDVNTDYFGRSRNPSNPNPGPFENPGRGDVRLKVQ